MLGIVLEMYGTGNGPSNKDKLFEAIQLATNRGIIVVALSQCLRGGVSLDTYDMGREFQQHGVVSGKHLWNAFIYDLHLITWRRYRRRYDHRGMYYKASLSPGTWDS
jgi:hypothetical protein